MELREKLLERLNAVSIVRYRLNERRVMQLEKIKRMEEYMKNQKRECTGLKQELRDELNSCISTHECLQEVIKLELDIQYRLSELK